jgi:hypothetical protein
MIYIEYMEHDRSIPAESLRLRTDPGPWPGEEAFSRDHRLAVLGRTLRLGPHPPYLALWRCTTFVKLQEWESYFRARKALHDAAARNGIHLCQAGCYTEVFLGPSLGQGIQYIEFFTHGPSQLHGTVARHYSRRAGQYPEGVLNAVLCRMGPLGPDPGGLAIWTFPGHAQVERIVFDRHWQQVIGIVRSGLYRKLGGKP